MNKISVVIIAKNEEHTIVDCLDSVSFADEIIVIDDGSTDRTVELAKLYGARVYEHKSNSFSEKRNLGLKKAKYKWLLYIDADERLSSELKKNILDVVKSNSNEFDAYNLSRKNFYLGNNEWPYIEHFLRLFRKSSLKEWQGKLHETPIISGKVTSLNGFILHYTHRDLKSMVSKTIEWSEIESELRFKANHPTMSSWRFFRVMFTGFYNSYIKQKGYTAGTAGLIESIYQAFSMFITYARLWELQNNSSKK